MKTLKQIEEMIDKCEESDLGGMTYEEGVKAALEWVTGWSTVEPIEED